MKDKSLTLLDHTAVGDEETADDVIHLAVGLQFSGFKSVMALRGWATTLSQNLSMIICSKILKMVSHELYEGSLGWRTHPCCKRHDYRSAA
jgi:hypothetical protein